VFACVCMCMLVIVKAVKDNSRQCKAAQSSVNLAWKQREDYAKNSSTTQFEGSAVAQRSAKAARKQRESGVNSVRKQCESSAKAVQKQCEGDAKETR
jgi:hypothetical protein